MVVSPRYNKNMLSSSINNRIPPPSAYDESSIGSSGSDKKSTPIHPSSPRMLSRSQYLLRIHHVVALVGIGALIGSFLTAYTTNNSIPDQLGVQLPFNTNFDSHQNTRALITDTSKDAAPEQHDNMRASSVSNTEISLETDSSKNMIPKDEIAYNVVSDVDSDEPWPRIAWLMSFPNSGTSFTTRLIRHATKKATATNYGFSNAVHVEEVKDKISLPVHEGELEGPFWSDPHMFETYSQLDTGYVLTKTHCGSRCFLCQPKEYIETAHTFLNRCLSGERRDKDKVMSKTRYDKSLVKKAVHLIRDPFDNVVSRYHLELGVLEKKDPKEFKKYSKDREGFRKFCSKWDAEFAGKEQRNFNIDDKLLAYIKDVPCHSDFFRYVQWHNLASTATRNLQIPTLRLHYESYEDNLEGNLNKLLTFLELEKIGETAAFIPGKRYRNYYTSDEVKALSKMLKELAYIDMWPLLEHYFDEDIISEAGR